MVSNQSAVACTELVERDDAERAVFRRFRAAGVTVSGHGASFGEIFWESANAEMQQLTLWMLQGVIALQPRATRTMK